LALASLLEVSHEEPVLSVIATGSFGNNVSAEL